MVLFISKFATNKDTPNIPHVIVKPTKLSGLLCVYRFDSNRVYREEPGRLDKM